MAASPKATMVKETKLWDALDLQLAQAQHTGPVNPPSLTIGSRSRKVVKSYQDENDTFPLSPFFFREHWDVSDEDYALLLQSMQLASNLLSVGIPFLAHLVPSNSIHADLEDQRLESKSVYQIPRKPRDKKQELEAKAELHEIAKVVKWQLNDTIATGKKWLGITRLVTEDRWGPRPWTDLIEEDVENSDRDLIDRGFQRRPLLIGIMKEYVDALKHYRNSNDEYLRATFLAGVTMTHEVAHAVWHQDFRSLKYGYGGVEPYFDDDCVSELGLSFLSSIFSGYSPFSIDRKVPTNFSSPLSWEKVHKSKDIDNLYRIDYAIPTAYIQTLLDQEFWNALDQKSGEDFEDEARKALDPRNARDPSQLLFPGLPEMSVTVVAPILVATAHVPEWTVSKYDGRAIWKNSYFDRRVNLRDHKLLKQVTESDKQLEISQLKLANPSLKLKLNYGQADDEEETTSQELVDSKRPIFDGSLRVALLDSTTPLKHADIKYIQVRYRPDSAVARTTSKKRLQPHNGHKVTSTGLTKKARLALDDLTGLDSDDEHGEDGDSIGTTNSVKEETKVSLDDSRKKAGQDYQFGFEAYHFMDVIGLLKDKHPSNIARYEIWFVEAFCMANHIPWDLPPVPEHRSFERKLLLDRLNPQHRAVIERIRQFCFRQAEIRFHGLPQALLSIKAESMSRVDDWSDNDLRKLCETQSLKFNGTRDELLGRVSDWLRDDLSDFDRKHNLNKSIADLEAAGLNLSEEDSAKWSTDDFLTYFDKNKLPIWGDRQTWYARHERHKEELKYGSADRTNINRNFEGLLGQRIQEGLEVYTWEANTKASYVSTLKCALFVNGIFPANSTLELFLGQDRQNPLEDDKLLTFYNPTDWKNLWLQVRLLKVEPTLRKQPHLPPIVYQSRNQVLGSYDPRTVPLPDLVKTIKPESEDDVQPDRIPMQIQRTYDLAIGGACPTLREIYQKIQSASAELANVVRPGGGQDPLRPHLRTLRAHSAQEMLDNLDDWQERVAEQEDEALRVVKPDEWVKKQKVLEANFPPGTQLDHHGRPILTSDRAKPVKHNGSHMADLYARVKVG